MWNSEEPARYRGSDEGGTMLFMRISVTRLP